MVLTLILAVVGSSGVASIVVACLQRHWSKKDREDGRLDALVTAQKVIMMDRVRWLGTKYIRDGAIPLEDKVTIHAMWDAYHALGGNGQLKTIMDEVDRLEVKG